MSVNARLPSFRMESRFVRCSCDHCGAHLIARSGFRLAGFCENCGSYEITQIAVEPTHASADRGAAPPVPQTPHFV